MLDRLKPRPPLRLPRVLFLLALLVLTAAVAGATHEGAARGLDAGAETQLLDALARSAIGDYAAELAAAPRIAGSPAARRTAASIAQRMRAWGLEVDEYDYKVEIPHARAVAVEITAPERRTLELPVDGPVGDAAAGSYSAAAGYSAAGDVTAPVVYANYGTVEDFALLRAQGIPVQGRVALVRYGHVFRGDKVANAERAGAAAVLLYSDPADDGERVGAVYPDGPFRPQTAIERGSIKIGAPGDPASPGYAAVPGAAPLPATESTATGLPAVPVVAIPAGQALRLMALLDNGSAPKSWHGGLSVPYAMASNHLRVRVAVDNEPGGSKNIRNVVGRLRGASRPDEVVILGAHYDSWTHGALDNASGTAALLAVAETMASLARSGHPPARTVLFAAWDAEEWGLIGSHEWGEQHAALLRESAVAYVNLDGVAGGPYFRASASPALWSLVREATALVPDPTIGVETVLQAWMRRTRSSAPAALPIALPGAGSDDAVFAFGHGVPTLSIGFTGAHGVYHSNHDTTAFVERFGDPGYRQHHAVAALASIAVWRLANHELAALDYRDYATVLSRALNGVDRAVRRAGWSTALVDTRPAWQAVMRLAEEAGAMSALRGGAERQAVAGPVERRWARSGVVAVERELLAAVGRGTQPWSRHLVFGPDPRNAYASILLPEVTEALRHGDALATIAALERLRHATRATATSLRNSRNALIPPAERGAVIAGR